MNDAALPAVQRDPVSKAVTLGVKFKTTTTGAVNGIRFYKGTQNTGTHVGSLWTGDGQLLALANGAEGGNGVYKCCAKNSFPTGDYRVDVMFVSP
ncbi:DUF4082 domain-containing protein [Streptosporangium amethystogenes]|uniref:DUF4082 domain-containing protein n=1 Tax=Streptosporangium amethystogenes TaxID=2002 RepID=UPI0004CC19D2|nr:DUF4082 domain-containing protein [Streptosporangium amethystogenes]